MDIAGRAGLFLEGKVSPELEGVAISITERGAAAPLITVVTNDMGAYRYKSPALYMPATHEAKNSFPISLYQRFFFSFHIMLQIMSRSRFQILGFC